jgi:hypothetical protein
MANPVTLELRASATASGAGTGTAVDMGLRRTAALVTVRATVVGAELKATIQTSPDGSTGWRQVAAMPALPAVGVSKRVLDGLDRYLRVVWPAGTDATFEAAAEAHQLYAEREDLLDSLSAELMERADRKHPGAVARALLNATGRAASALAPIHAMPLTTVPLELKDAVTSLAALQVLVQNGLAGGGIDELVASRAEHARLWLKQVAERKAMISGIEPAQAEAVKGSSGNPTYPDTYADRFSNNWGDF